MERHLEQSWMWLSAIYFTRPCCGAPLDQPHEDDCKTGIAERQADDWYCRRGDELRARQEPDSPPPSAPPGETIARAFRRTD